MSYSIRHLAPESSLCQELHLDVIDHLIAPALISEVLSDTGCWETRERRLNMQILISLVIAMGLLPSLSVPHVLQKMAQGLRYLWPDPDLILPGASAVSQRRKQLGVQPLRELFERVCLPQATADMPFAFAFGLRLMAMDGTSEKVADTFANDLTFGRPHSQHGVASFPQVHGVYLQECGTHQIVDAAFGASHRAEQALAYQLLRHLKPGMLLLLDRGFFSARFLFLLRSLGVHVLARLSNTSVPTYCRQLRDGSYLAYLYPHDDSGHQRGTPMLVRVIEYRIEDPQREGQGDLHRLVTTLLNPRTIPGEQVIQTYHERWEIELTIDEMDTHQRLCQTPLRSHTPDGVLQELYGVLLGHYATRSVMKTSAQAEHLDCDRLSFTHAITVITNAISEVQQTQVSQRALLIERVLRDVRQKLLPVRRLRCNPRVVKSRRATFPARTQKHRMVPTLEKPFAEVIVLLKHSPRYREPLPLKRIQKMNLLI